MITRRQVLQGLTFTLAGGFATGSYAMGVEPYRLNLTSYKVTPVKWPDGLNLKVAALADLHACDPWMTVDHVHHIVERTNALEADIIVLLGDYTAGRNLFRHRDIPGPTWAGALSALRAPLGVHAILGNHDWWDDRDAQKLRHGPTQNRLALEAVGIPVYENDAVRLTKGQHAFWLAGLGDQLAFPAFRDKPNVRRKRMGHVGIDDMAATLAKVTDKAPVVLMAHEPDIFPDLPQVDPTGQIAVTLSGHTHGGQVRIAGYSPIVPSVYGRRFAYGHVVENSGRGTADRHIVVSGGLGCSGLPIRLGMPPEVVLVELASCKGQSA